MIEWKNLENEFNKKAEDAFIYLKNEFQKINSGQVNPNIFNKLKIFAYEQWTPLIQLANISALDARHLVIKPYDRNLIKIIAKSLAESEYKVNPQINSDTIHIIFAPLTQETRIESVKKAKQCFNNAIQKLRNIRQEIQSIYKKDQTISKDDVRYFEDQLNKLTKNVNKQLENIFENKQTELMKV